MTDNIVDFETRKQSHVFKRKEAKVDALKRAFRQARGEAEVAPAKRRKKRRKSPKK